MPRKAVGDAAPGRRGSKARHNRGMERRDGRKLSEARSDYLIAGRRPPSAPSDSIKFGRNPSSTHCGGGGIQGSVSPVCLLRIFGRIQQSLRSRRGWRPAIKASLPASGRPKSKAFFGHFWRFSVAPPLLSAVLRAWGLRSPGAASPTALRAVLGLSEPSKQSTAADGGSLNGNQSVAPSRCRFKSRCTVRHQLGSAVM
jgi:hypothetical protein